MWFCSTWLPRSDSEDDGMSKVMGLLPQGHPAPCTEYLRWIHLNSHPCHPCSNLSSDISEKWSSAFNSNASSDKLLIYLTRQIVPWLDSSNRWKVLPQIVAKAASL